MFNFYKNYKRNKAFGNLMLEIGATDIYKKFKKTRGRKRRNFRVRHNRSIYNSY